MRLSELAAGFDVQGGDPVITGITEDSRTVAPGMLFVAVAGASADGHAYVAEAVARGAAAVAGERLEGVFPPVARVRVVDSRHALALMAARCYGHPAAELGLLGFTGTFGKTSTSDVLRSILCASGRRCGVLGSLGARYGRFARPGSGLTTPAPVELHASLRGMRDAGADEVIVEVTSHALRMRRVAGITFSGGLLAAIRSGEHTDFHGTYDDYVAAKRLFLDYLAPDAMLAYDADNEAARSLAGGRPRGRTAGFSLEGRHGDLVLSDVEFGGTGTVFSVAGPLAGARRRLHSGLLGAGHLRNVALALTYALAQGVGIETAAAVIRGLRPLPRRMERYTVAGRTVLDDTAAHPDSLHATFEVAAQIPHGRLVVVYAVRGSRGVSINARNARALAALAPAHGVDALILSAAAETAGPADAVRDDEMASACDALSAGRAPFAPFDTLRDAIAEALARTGAGDLIVLVGAQGMNAGRQLLLELAG